MANEFKVKKGLIIEGSSGTVLDVQGSVGQLFSVTDSLTGDLFAVSDISGIPILNVNSSGAVDIDGTLDVSGSITVGTGNLSLTSNGTITTGGYWHLISAANGNGYLDAGGTIFIRDLDDSNADRITIDTATGNTTFAGSVSASNLSGTNTGDQTLPTLSSLGALSTTGKAADSNLLDGIDSTDVLHGNANGTNDSVTTDLDGLDKTGFYTSSAFVTKPSSVSNWMYVNHIKLYNSNTRYQKQIGYDTYDDRMWLRTKNDNTWTSWKQVWNEGDFANNSANWNTAYGWGNHASAGYITDGNTGWNNTYGFITASSSITGSSSSSGKLYANGGVTTQPGTGNLLHTGQISNGTTGLFAASNNANSIITLNKHSGNYDSQLGFSSNGNIYYRNFSNSTAFTTQAWNQVWHSGNFANNSANWNTAYGWGNHASAGYASSSTTLSGYGITDAVSLGADNVFTGDNEFEGDLLRTNQRISNDQEYPLGHYTPGETVFELDPTWSDRELRQYFGNSNVSWDQVANAPGGYAVYIDGSVSVGGAYNSGFPYIPIDQDGIYYMEVWIKNAGTAQGHYMGSIDYEADFTAPSSGAGNPGSYGYFTMSNYTGAAEWTKKSGYITGHHNSNTGAFETDATYWTPMALFNYSAGSGTRACWISGWKVIRVDHVGDRTFQDDVKVKGKLKVDTLDTNTASTTALVMNGSEVEKRTLGSNAFNSTAFTTLAIGTTSSTAMAGNTTTITSTQATAIANNTAKVGITATQAGHISTNNGKVSDTGTPAILSDGNTPTLNTNISAAEVRSLIGAGTGSSNLAIGTTATTAMAGNTSLFDGAYSSLSSIPTTFAPSSHNHNDIYYTETEIDSELDTLSASLRANINITGGGTVTIDSSGYIKNSARFIVIANGRGTHFATSGYFDINIPTSGTVTGVGGAESRTATSNGVEIKTWEALYYILPVGSSNASIAGNFRISRYNSNVVIPETWVLIAVRNGDTGQKVWVINKYGLELGQSVDTATYDSRYSQYAATAGAVAYANVSGTPTIPSGNAIIDWTTDQGSTKIHASNYTDTDTVYTHPTSAGNKHVPTGGAAGQFLKYSSSGTAVWATPSYTTNTDTVYTHPTSAGNKHIPTGGAAGQFLKYSSSGTATWATPSYTTNTNTQLSNEQVQDIVGAMFSGNSESNITATYQDGDGTIDLTVAANYGSWDLVADDDTTFRVDSTEHVKFQGANISGTGTQADPFLVNTPDTNTTYTADGNYGMTLSGTAFRLENDRRRNSSTQDIHTGNTHDYTFYDADIGIRWYTANAEEMRLEDDGDLHVDGDVIAFSTTVSDQRLKDDIQTIENASEKVSKLRGVEYTWNEGSRKGQREIGVIAQEVEAVVPEVVHEKKLPFVGDETYKTVDYEKLVALLIESNKELLARVETLEAKLDGTTK